MGNLRDRGVHLIHFQGVTVDSGQKHARKARCEGRGRGVLRGYHRSCHQFTKTAACATASPAPPDLARVSALP